MFDLSMLVKTQLASALIGSIYWHNIPFYISINKWLTIAVVSKLDMQAQYLISALAWTIWFIAPLSKLEM